MSQPEVVITGIGVVSPIGHGKKEFAHGLRHGISGIRRIEALEKLNFACQVGAIPQGIDEKAALYFTPDELIGMNHFMIYAAIAAVDAFKDAGLPLSDLNSDLVYHDTGAIIGTGIGGIETFANIVCPGVLEGKVKRLGSTIVERIMMSSASAKVGGLLGLGNQVTSNSSACSTGTEAVIMGAQRIKDGLAKRMVVGGAEGSDPHVWCGFDAMRVLSKRFNDQPEKASRPMSASAGGFVPGSGAGIIVLEDKETALSRGAYIYAEVAGSAINSGGMRRGGSITAPSPDGVVRCLRSAMTSANLKPKEIDYINGHLTATMADPWEFANWSKALELAPENFPYINSTKSMIGHALGASGALEIIATLLQMEQDFIHPSLNCEDLHPEIQAYEKSIVRSIKETKIKIAAKASFGFGDVNSCVILKRS